MKHGKNRVISGLLLASVGVLLLLNFFRIENMAKKLVILSRNLTEANYALDVCRLSKKDLHENDLLHSKNVVSSLIANFKNKIPQSRSNINKIKLFKILVHLDLKGAPPNMNYLLKILPFLKKLGATTILIEYEDMFPYDGVLGGVASKNAYNKQEIKLLLKTANSLAIDVIPLIQSFGHLEFALKLEKFSHLREVSKYIDMVCPLKNGSKDLVAAMIDQIIDLHPDIKHLHIGGDEVFHLQMCRACFQSRKSKFELYLHHMIPVLQHIHTRSKGLIKPIIWDDMLRRFNNKQLRRMSKLTDIMVWSYIPDVSKNAAFPDGMWKKYATAFDNVWIASSFKGGLSPNQNTPPIKMHIENHISWLRVLSTLPENMKITGIALTGWSRFDHLATMCELFPAAVPSLAVCLEILNKGVYDKYLLDRVSDKLGLESGIQFKKEFFSNYVVESGSFPGSDIYSLILELENFISWYENIKIRLDSWGNERQYQNNILSIIQIEGVKESIKQITQNLDTFSSKAMKNLKKLYFEEDIDEWMEDKVYSFSKNVNDLAVRTNKILKQGKYD